MGAIEMIVKVLGIWNFGERERLSRKTTGYINSIRRPPIVSSTIVFIVQGVDIGMDGVKAATCAVLMAATLSPSSAAILLVLNALMVAVPSCSSGKMPAAYSAEACAVVNAATCAVFMAAACCEPMTTRSRVSSAATCRVLKTAI